MGLTDFSIHSQPTTTQHFSENGVTFKSLTDFDTKLDSREYKHFYTVQRDGLLTVASLHKNKTEIFISNSIWASEADCKNVEQFGLSQFHHLRGNKPSNRHICNITKTALFCVVHLFFKNFQIQKLSIMLCYQRVYQFRRYLIASMNNPVM